MKLILNRKILVIVLIVLITATLGLKFFNNSQKPADGEMVVRFVDMVGTKETGRNHLDSILSDPELAKKFTYVYIQQGSPQFTSHVKTYKVDMNNATVFTDREGTKVYAIYKKILTKEELVKIAKEMK